MINIERRLDISKLNATHTVNEGSEMIKEKMSLEEICFGLLQQAKTG